MDRGSHINESIRPGGVSVALQKKNEINKCSQLSPPDTVNFYDFNETCQNQQTDSLIAGIARHEGWGDPMLSDSAASGHQRRIEIAAATPEGDPAAAIEDLFTPDGVDAITNMVKGRLILVNAFLEAAADTAHVYVKNNYEVSNWVWDSTTTSSQGEQFNLLTIPDSLH